MYMDDFIKLDNSYDIDKKKDTLIGNKSIFLTSVYLNFFTASLMSL